MIEPLVSLPMENGTAPAAVAAAGPLDEPPAHVLVSQGLSAGPVSEASGCS